VYDPNIFYEETSEKLRPGDILYIKNWQAYEDSYWMILTSFCDLERRDHTLLSKIKPLASLPNINEGVIGNIRNYKVFFYFYLPSLEGEFPESIVHYGMLSPISRQMLDQARLSGSDCRHIISLSEETRKLFQFHFANYITRDETLEFLKPHVSGLAKILKRLG